MNKFYINEKGWGGVISSPKYKTYNVIIYLFRGEYN